ncbi:hypothetical protein ACROYT_G032938 [Oculina patagonica]
MSYRNGTTGEWQSFNLSGNVLVLQNGPDALSLQIKITRLSSTLRKFRGYVMKLQLKCTTRLGENEESCLLFKAKGTISFPLNCSLPTSTVPLSTAITTATTRINSPTPTRSSTFIVTPTTSIREPIDPGNNGIIAAIVTIGTVLCLSLICAFVLVMYRYTNMCKSRGNQARNADNDFDVISNPGPQTYRIQEEPLYVEVPDIYPCGKGSVGNATKQREERPSVVLNPYVNEAMFSAGTRTTGPPLPSRPELHGNPRTRIDAAGAAYQNEGCNAINEETDGSIVLKNPRVEEASSSSLPHSGNDFTKVPEAHEHCEESVGHPHHHVEDDFVNDTVRRESEGTGEDVYQGLVKDKRAQSVFVCQSCNDNPVYQRLSMHCPHGAKDETKEKRASFYASLKELERGSRESVYASRSRIAEESAAENEENRNSVEGEGLPEYQTLEPDESVLNEDLDEPVNHDYNVLEGPEETCDEADEHTNDKIQDSDLTSEDLDLPVDPSNILNMEDNPGYAKPWKAKGEQKLPDPSEIVNVEDNPDYAKLSKTKENPDLPNELSEFPNVEDNPSYAKPWKAKGELNLPEPAEVLNIDDNPAYAKPWKAKEDPGLPNEPSDFLNIENNPAYAYAKPWKTKAVEPCVRRRAYSM